MEGLAKSVTVSRCSLHKKCHCNREICTCGLSHLPSIFIFRIQMICIALGLYKSSKQPSTRCFKCQGCSLVKLGEYKAIYKKFLTDRVVSQHHLERSSPQGAA